MALISTGVPVYHNAQACCNWPTGSLPWRTACLLISLSSSPH